MLAQTLGVTNNQQIAVFRKDFLELMRVAFGIEQQFRHGHTDMSKMLKKFKVVLTQFHKKYKHLKVQLPKQDILQPRLLILAEPSVKGLYEHAVSKIQGLFALGTSAGNTMPIDQQEAFFQVLDNVKDSLYVQFKSAEGNDSLFLEYLSKEKAIMVHYDFETIFSAANPVYQLLEYYAVKEGIQEKIDVHGKLLQFTFVDLSEKAMKLFLKHFDTVVEE